MKETFSAGLFLLVALISGCSVPVKPDKSGARPEVIVKNREIIGSNYFVRGNTYWFKPIPFKIVFPDEWNIFCEESYNPRVVFTSPNNRAQAELYWVALYEKIGLNDYIDSFLSKFGIAPVETLRLAHPDGELVYVSDGKNRLCRGIFFLKSLKRIYIVSCTADAADFEANEPFFFELVDNFRLFEGYEIR